MNQTQTAYTKTSPEDVPMESALREYCEHLPDPEREAFEERLHADPVFHWTIGRALTDTALLIAAANVIQDDALYADIAGQTLGVFHLYGSQVRQLRCFYLENHTLLQLGDDVRVVSYRVRDQRLAQVLQQIAGRH